MSLELRYATKWIQMAGVSSASQFSSSLTSSSASNDPLQPRFVDDPKLSPPEPGPVRQLPDAARHVAEEVRNEEGWRDLVCKRGSEAVGAFWMPGTDYRLNQGSQREDALRKVDDGDLNWHLQTG